MHVTIEIDKGAGLIIVCHPWRFDMPETRLEMNRGAGLAIVCHPLRITLHVSIGSSKARP